MSTSLFAIPAAALYVLSGLMIGLRLFSGPDERKPPRAAALAAGFTALFLHAVALAYTTLTAEGLNVAFFNILSLVAWTIAALLLASSVTKPVENLGIVVLPLAGLAALAAWRFPGMQLLPETAPWGLRAHVLVSLLSYALLALASVQAILLAIQDRHLHRRQPGGFVRALPPLQTMEALLFEMIAVGFVLLSVGPAGSSSSRTCSRSTSPTRPSCRWRRGRCSRCCCGEGSASAGAGARPCAGRSPASWC